MTYDIVYTPSTYELWLWTYEFCNLIHMRYSIIYEILSELWHMRLLITTYVRPKILKPMLIPKLYGPY